MPTPDTIFKLAVIAVIGVLVATTLPEILVFLL
jgi:hypothetical protein